MDGLEKKELPPPPVEENIYLIPPDERKKRNIDTLPGNLGEALEALKGDPVIMKALDPLTPKYIQWRSDEWKEYSIKVYDWERERYLEEVFPLEYLKHK
jgi:glutamine synthetase